MTNSVSIGDADSIKTDIHIHGKSTANPMKILK